MNGGDDEKVEVSDGDSWSGVLGERELNWNLE